MTVTPKTEKQLMEERNFPEGEYPFEVVLAKDGISKRSGNEMIHLKLKCFTQDGRQFFVDDYLMDSMGFKLRHFCEEVGLLEKYEAGQLKDYDCDKKEGTVQIIIQKSKESQYPDKNSVKDYGVAKKKVKEEKPAAPTPEPDPEVSDDVPF